MGSLYADNVGVGHACRIQRDIAAYRDDVLAVTLATAKDIAVVAMIALIVIALLMAKTMAGMSRKLLSLIIFAALAFGVWNQRQSLQTCADRVQESGIGRTCRFFGNDITIESPLNG